MAHAISALLRLVVMRMCDLFDFHPYEKISSKFAHCLLRFGRSNVAAQRWCSVGKSVLVADNLRATCLC